ncbi:MAG: hypothetical protein ACRDWT_05115 [Jatrophihabitantaceae bacterium]
MQIVPLGNPFSEFPLVPQLTLDFAEAALYAGHAEHTRTHVRIICESGCAGVSTRIGAVVVGAEALVASDDGAPVLFERALTLPGVEGWPFERARIELACGLRLRRMRSYTAARRHLDAARSIFSSARHRGPSRPPIPSAPADTRWCVTMPGHAS